MDASTPTTAQQPPLTAEQTRALWRAVMLSPSLEVCEALLRGEKVPLPALDPLWVKRLRL